MDAYAPRVDQCADGAIGSDVDAHVGGLASPAPHDDVARFGILAIGQATALEPIPVRGPEEASSADLGDESCFLVDAVDKPGAVEVGALADLLALGAHAEP